MNKYSFPVKNILLISGLTFITLLSTLALNYIKIYERSVLLAEATENRKIGERAIVEAFKKIPVNEYLEYKEIKILRRIDSETFEVLSHTKANLHDANILFIDYAEFKDKEGILIARTSPCITRPTLDPRLKEFCIKQSYTDWFQYQFWEILNITRNNTTKVKWKFKQRLIPPGAVEIRVCSDQVITIHKNKEFGDVEKIQHVCSGFYKL